jgi:hypothetical protein
MAMASQAQQHDTQTNNDTISPEIKLRPYTPEEITESMAYRPYLTLADFTVPKTQMDLDNLIRSFANFELTVGDLKRRGIGDYIDIWTHLDRLNLEWPRRDAEDEPDPVIRAERLAGQKVLLKILTDSVKRHPREPIP